MEHRQSQLVAALTEPRHRNKLFEVTGPRALTFAQCIQEMSEALGRPLRFTTVPIDAYINALREQGVPEDLQWLLRELFTVVFDGRNCHVMPGVEEALGRPATDFRVPDRGSVNPPPSGGGQVGWC